MRPDAVRFNAGFAGRGGRGGRGVNSKGVIPVLVIWRAGYVRKSGDDCSDLIRRDDVVDGGPDPCGALVHPLCSPNVWPECPTVGMLYGEDPWTLLWCLCVGLWCPLANMVRELSESVICNRGFVRTSGAGIPHDAGGSENSGTASRSCGSFFSAQVQCPPWQQEHEIETP